MILIIAMIVIDRCYQEIHLILQSCNNGLFFNTKKSLGRL